MVTYWFSVITNEEITEDLTEQLFEAGCDDGVCGRSNGGWSVGFTRESASLETAIRTACEQIRSTGLTMCRVEIDQGEFTQISESA